MKILNIYKCGDIYKYTSTQKTRNKGNSVQIKRNDTKLNNNIVRSKSKIKDLILCNKFHYFYTLTIKADRFNLDGFRKKVSQRIRNARMVYKGLDLFYLFVPEHHKDGAWHFHGLLSSDFSEFMILNEHGYLTCFILNDLGYDNVSVIEDLNKAANYITKYVSKDLINLGLSKHTYFCSRGLLRPQLIDYTEYSNLTFDNLFFKTKEDNKVKYTKKYYKNITTLL